MLSNRELRISRQNADFYEALKRMGDKDSPILRASAAELLATMASQDEYYAPARSQLIHAFLLEEDPVVLGSIQDACDRLIGYNSDDILPRLEIVRQKLEVQVLEALAPLTLNPDGSSPDSLSDEQWSLIEAAIPQTDITRQDLQQFIEARPETFSSFQSSASTALAKLNGEAGKTEMPQNWRAFKTAVLRLHLVNTLLDRNEQKKK